MLSHVHKLGFARAWACSCLLLDLLGRQQNARLDILPEAEVLGIGKYTHQDVRLAVSPTNKSRSQFALLSSALQDVCAAEAARGPLQNSL